MSVGVFLFLMQLLVVFLDNIKWLEQVLYNRNEGSTLQLGINRVIVREYQGNSMLISW